MIERENLIKSLEEQNEEFKDLQKKHLEYEAKLEKIAEKKFLTPEEEIKKKQLKKLKLLGRDRMEDIINEHINKPTV